MTLILVVVIAAIAAGLGLHVWLSSVAERRRSDARVAALASAIDGAEDAVLPSLFGRTPSRSSHGLVKVTVGFLVVSAVVFVVAIVIDAREPRMLDVVASPSPALDDTAIALVAMSHARQGDAFVIHGIIRNQGHRCASGLTATITVLDATGRMVASGRAPIDDQALPPGESSRFSVRLDAVHAVERYRVSFMGPAGVVRHADVRSRAAAAPRTSGPDTPASSGF